MIIIQEKIVHEDILKEQFLCNLSACKGACCWEGDYGAPLTTSEIETIERIYDDVKPFLSEEGKAVIEEKGLYVYYDGMKEYGTTLLESGACTFLTKNEAGIALCGLEQAHNAGATDFYKPISCHLYPIRTEENHSNGLETLEYDRWDICSAACSLGKKKELPVYKFLKDAIIRKYGEDFYEEMDAAAEHLKEMEAD